MIIKGWDIRGAKIITKSKITFDYLVVAGGGGGGARGGGGGGGGGVVTGQLTVDSGTVAFSIGGGGTAGGYPVPFVPAPSLGAPGSNSQIITPVAVFGSIDATGGGGGGGGDRSANFDNRDLVQGLPGGSGGGGRGGGFNNINNLGPVPGPIAGGTGIPGQGFGGDHRRLLQ